MIGAKDRLLFDGADWTFETINRTHEAIEEIALGEMGLSIYPNQIEVITAEQMLDAYAATGMPIYYAHWSFGKRFVQHEVGYRKGFAGLAYEIVINSSPCISYVMEGNTMTMQTLVIAHAAFGHNHFFRNNYTFKDWTDPSGILDYLVFARSYIASCEDRYGVAAVESVLDAAHALMGQGVDSAPRRRRPDLKSEEERQRERRLHDERMYNELWRTLPK
ncbi:MAG TPA: SpoVR family protein, partial [Beijerinckiaceae bacterium]